MPSSVPTFKKICLHCGQEFVAYNTRTDYCSDRCSKLAYKERKRIERLKETSLEVRENERLILLDKNWLSISDAARLLQMSRTTLYKVLQHNGVELRKFTARTVRVAREDLEHISETRETLINNTIQNQEENLGNWMSKKQVMEKYGISDSGMYQVLKRRGIKPHKIGTMSFFDKDEMYRVFHKEELEGVNEWYTFAELTESTGMKLATLYDFCSKYNIPRKRDKDGRGLISKKHWDRARGNNIDKDAFYTPNQIAEKYKMSRNHLYTVLKEKQVQRIKIGCTTYFDREIIDQIFEYRLAKIQ